MLKTVAVVLFDDVALFEFGVLAEVFGIDRVEDGVPKFDFRVCALEAGRPLSARNGTLVGPPYGLDGLLGADLVAIPATRIRGGYPPEVLRRATSGGRPWGDDVVGLLRGVRPGKAGLLDGRPCTAHWKSRGAMHRYPDAKVNPDVLFVDDGDLITSAGTAGIDACLHLVRGELGSAVATRIARRMVVPPSGWRAEAVRRPAGAGVFGREPDAGADLDAGERHRRASGRVVGAAGRNVGAHVRPQVSCRDGDNTAQVAVNAAGAARPESLGRDRSGVESIARRSGFGTGALLRHHFRRVVGVAQDYRRSFSSR